MKQQEVVKLSNEELNEQLVENKKKYNELKMAHAVSPLENPIQIKALRKSIARIMTELNKRDDNLFILYEYGKKKFKKRKNWCCYE